MSKYGALWQHMFRLRRVQLALEGAWATLQVRAAAPFFPFNGCQSQRAAGMSSHGHWGSWQASIRTQHTASAFHNAAGAAAPQAGG